MRKQLLAALRPRRWTPTENCPYFQAGPHTASRANPPAEALAQQGRESRRAYESDWHIWTEAEIDAYTVAWGVPRTVAEMVLNLEQLEAAAARHVNMENLGDLARNFEEYATKRFRDGEDSERERYSQQGE